MGHHIAYRQGNAPRGRRLGVAMLGIGFAVMSAACASTGPIKRPSEPLVVGQPAWPEDVSRAAERADRVCATRESQLVFDYEEGKQDQEKFKTIMGSVTGGVGTVGGAITGVGAYVIDSPDTMKKVTGVTGIITAGLGAVGTVITFVVTPGKSKMQNASQSLTTIEQKRAAARAALTGKDPSAWSDADKEAFAKAAKELEAACK